jgi:hypothetical protein
MKRQLKLEERLAILQAADTYRKWYSLDDHRVCILCERMIIGRQIEITRDQRGRYLLHCPTEGCPSTAREWVYHLPPSMAKKAEVNKPAREKEIDFMML